MKLWQCALIPLTILSTQSHILKFQDFKKQSSSCDLHTSFIPFSISFIQSLSYPFYTEKLSSVKTTLYFNQSDLEMNIFLRKIINQKHSISSDVPSWSKCTVHFALHKNAFFTPDQTFLALPDELTCRKFQQIMKYLYVNDYNLILACESESETTPAIMSALTDTFALISTYHPVLDVSTFRLPILGEWEKQNTLMLEAKISDNINNLKSEISGKEMQFKFPDTHLKPFQIECMESWFTPTSVIGSFTSDSSIQPACNDNVKKILEILQSSKSKTIKSKKSKPPSPKQEICKSNEADIEDYDLEADVNYEKLIEILTDLYKSVVNSNVSVFHGGKRIVKYASTFFLRKSITSYEENMKSFMAEYFISTNWKITEKYKENQDSNVSTMKINECQLQSIIALEMEVFFPTSDKLNCVNAVTSFLRLMSFYSGASELNKFLCEDLKRNYWTTMSDVLVEIGDELDVPLTADGDEEDLSPDDRSDAASSEALFKMQGSVLSNQSMQSVSSTSSRGDSRKLMRRRSDISDSHKSRQVLLPATSPRKKRKSHGLEKISIRYSPRLASKKKRERAKATDCKPETVRRNLFPKDRKPYTPRVSKVYSPIIKKKSATPKRNCNLKTQLAAETPSYKQNLSKQQRRKSLIKKLSVNSEHSFIDVAESPTISNVKDSEHLRLLWRFRHSQQSSETDGPSGSSTMTASGCDSYTIYSPDNKCRLSLKLFRRETLTSPTAHTGLKKYSKRLKKCSKRLFDPVSPCTSRPPSKKPKLCDGTDSEKPVCSSSIKRTALFEPSDS